MVGSTELKNLFGAHVESVLDEGGAVVGVEVADLQFQRRIRQEVVRRSAGTVAHCAAVLTSTDVCRFAIMV